MFSNRYLAPLLVALSAYLVLSQEPKGSIILDQIGRPVLIFEQIMDVTKGDEGEKQKIEPLTLYRGRCKRTL